MNVLNEQVIEEMPLVLDAVEGNADVKGALIISGKAGSFIAGADIKMLDKVTSAKEAEQIAKHGQVGINSEFALPREIFNLRNQNSAKELVLWLYQTYIKLNRKDTLFFFSRF